MGGYIHIVHWVRIHFSTVFPIPVCLANMEVSRCPSVLEAFSCIFRIVFVSYRMSVDAQCLVLSHGRQELNFSRRLSFELNFRLDPRRIRHLTRVRDALYCPSVYHLSKISVLLVATDILSRTMAALLHLNLIYSP